MTYNLPHRQHLHRQRHGAGAQGPHNHPPSICRSTRPPQRSRPPVLPLQERTEKATDESDLEAVYHTERHLLYVACTRARDRLSISGVDPASEFLDDLAR
jgi:ATP-dependent exoDNAse (exonuclease V) beta subunit